MRQHGRWRPKDIELLTATSPQAKGRVERAKQTLRGRLAKEMRAQGIDSMQGAKLAFLFFAGHKEISCK